MVTLTRSKTALVRYVVASSRLTGPNHSVRTEKFGPHRPKGATMYGAPGTFEAYQALPGTVENAGPSTFGPIYFVMVVMGIFNNLD